MPQQAGQTFNWQRFDLQRCPIGFVYDPVNIMSVHPEDCPYPGIYNCAD